MSASSGEVRVVPSSWVSPKGLVEVAAKLGALVTAAAGVASGAAPSRPSASDTTAAARAMRRWVRREAPRTSRSRASAAQPSSSSAAPRRRRSAALRRPRRASSDGDIRTPRCAEFPAQQWAKWSPSGQSTLWSAARERGLS